MVAKQEWKTAEPGNSKIAALTTELNDLKEKFALVTQSMSRPGSAAPGSRSGNGRRVDSSIPAWRLTKTLGDKVDRDGKTWFWCPHQHNDGKGMYVTHHPNDHTAWKERKANEKKQRQSGNDTSDKPAPPPLSSSNKTDPPKSLALSDNLKAAMVARFCCCEGDADKLWTEVVKSSK